LEETISRRTKASKRLDRLKRLIIRICRLSVGRRCQLSIRVLMSKCNHNSRQSHRAETNQSQIHSVATIRSQSKLILSRRTQYSCRNWTELTRAKCFSLNKQQSKLMHPSSSALSGKNGPTSSHSESERSQLQRRS
jgi:hypothetical protein